MNLDAYLSAEAALWDHVGARPIDRTLALPRPRLSVRVQDVGAGPPTLLVHGGPNAGTTFAPLVGHLPDRRCLLLDRPGCGLSEPPAYGEQSLRELAVATIAATLDALGLDRVDIVASSMGGLWSIWFALAHPERVRAMVQLGPPAGLPGMRTPAFLRMMATPGLGALMTRRPADLAKFKEIMGWIGHAQAVRAGVFDGAYGAWGVALGAHTATMATERGLIRTAVHPVTGMRRACRLTDAELRALACPVHWVWGDADPFGDLGLLARARAATSAPAPLVIPGGGHLPWLDDPAGVAAVIRAFLDGAAPGAQRAEGSPSAVARAPSAPLVGGAVA